MSKVLQDTKKYIHLAIIPFLFGMFLLISFIYSIDDMILYILSIFSDNPEVSTANSWIEQISIASEDSFLLKILIFLGELSMFIIGIFIFFILIGVVNSLIQAIFAPFIINKIVKSMAKDDGIELYGYGTLVEEILFTLKEFAKLVALLIVAIPLYFVPILNIVVFHLILYRFFHKSMQRDISTYIFSDQEVTKIKSIYPITMKLYLLNLIPIVNLFIIVYQVVSVTNSYFAQVKTLRR
jgi:hypothetical protein